MVTEIKIVINTNIYYNKLYTILDQYFILGQNNPTNLTRGVSK